MPAPTRLLSTALKPTLLALLALATVVGGLTAPAQAADAPRRIAVIDAGSSGSRLALFEPPTSPYEAPRLAFEARSVKPGLSTLATQGPDAAGASLAPMLLELRSHLEQQGIDPASVPVSLLATAGLRRLALTDPTAAQQAIDSGAGAIRAVGFPVKEARILPGQLEAAYAWVDANALAGTLASARRSVGIVEIGGASTQVAFRAPAGTPGAVPVPVAGRTIPVVAVSYLGLGANEARATAFTGGRGSQCLPNNAASSTPAVFAVSGTAPVPGPDASFAPVRCQRSYADTIRSVSATMPAPLALARLQSLPGFARTSFEGLAVAGYVYSDFKIPAGANEDEALSQAMRALCVGPDAWAKVVQVYGGKTSEFAQTSCGNSAYVRQLLFGPAGLGVSPSRFSPAAGQDRDPSWSSGYALSTLGR